MNSAWTRRGIVVTAVLSVVWMSGGLSERWLGHTLAAPESEQPKAPATTIAMIDVAYIFSNCKDFKAEKKTLEQRGQGICQQLAATQTQLQLLKARMEQTEDKGEKEKLEVELATQTAEFQLSARKIQQEFEKTEAKVYYEYYSLLQEETKKYCRAKGIHVALKFARDAIRPDDRISITQGLQRPIVFSDAPDISEDILKALDAAVAVKAAREKTEETKTR